MNKHLAEQQQKQRHHPIGAAVGMAIGNGNNQSHGEAPPQPEIPREMDRLIGAARSVQNLTEELSKRLSAFRQQSVTGGTALAEADIPVSTGFGSAIRDVTGILESTAAGLRYELDALAI